MSKEYIPVNEMIKSIVEETPIDFYEHFKNAMDERLALVVEVYAQYLKENMFVDSPVILSLPQVMEFFSEVIDSMNEEPVSEGRNDIKNTALADGLKEIIGKNKGNYKKRSGKVDTLIAKDGNWKGSGGDRKKAKEYWANVFKSNEEPVSEGRYDIKNTALADGLKEIIGKNKGNYKKRSGKVDTLIAKDGNWKGSGGDRKKAKEYWANVFKSNEEPVSEGNRFFDIKRAVMFNRAADEEERDSKHPDYSSAKDAGYDQKEYTYSPGDKVLQRAYKSGIATRNLHDQEAAAAEHATELRKKLSKMPKDHPDRAEHEKYIRDLEEYFRKNS